jgi:hypothetical protein
MTDLPNIPGDTSIPELMQELSIAEAPLQAFDQGYEAGSMAAANAILGFLGRIGSFETAAAVKAAWEDGSIIHEPDAQPPQPQPQVTRLEAKAQGFTGNQCTNCNSMKMKVSGHCEVCVDCGTTTGCS